MILYLHQDDALSRKQADYTQNTLNMSLIIWDVYEYSLEIQCSKMTVNLFS